MHCPCSEAEPAVAGPRAGCGCVCCRPPAGLDVPFCCNRGICLLPDQTQQHMLRADLMIRGTQVMWSVHAELVAMAGTGGGHMQRLRQATHVPRALRKP